MSKIAYYHHEFLNRMRQQTDPMADRAVQTVYASENPAKFREVLGALHRNGDPLPPGLPEEVAAFFESSGQLPLWADAKKMQRGADFFSRFGGHLMMMLGLLSLPYDYAAAHGAQVLYLSERLHYNPGKRLTETGHFILDVTAKHAFSDRGKAIRSAQKVRLMHAAIRYHLRKNPAWHSQEWGQPINQEDMAATNLSVSLIPVRGLRKLDLKIAHEDMLAYIHLWNVVGYLLGVEESLLPDTARETYVLEKMITARQHASSQAGQSLTRSLLAYIQQNADARFSRMAPVYMRYLLGDQIADWLAIPPYRKPEAFMISTVKGLHRLRNLAPSHQKSYLKVWLKVNQQTKSLKKDTTGLFKMPQSLTT